MAKKIAKRIEEKEQDPNAFQSFNDPPTATNIEGFIHPLAQLLFHCETRVGLLETLSYKETLDLGGAQENFLNIAKPSKDD